ncbi:hypothetical protein QBC44DRAFT_379716 [Cladorrhinum sp. PSN332]|nr:hypothetical protein QBC44DRAFT_379716 [Cladorrhinum sp. PSN332]
MTTYAKNNYELIRWPDVTKKDDQGSKRKREMDLVCTRYRKSVDGLDWPLCSLASCLAEFGIEPISIGQMFSFNKLIALKVPPPGVSDLLDICSRAIKHKEDLRQKQIKELQELLAAATRSIPVDAPSTRFQLEIAPPRWWYGFQYQRSYEVENRLDSGTSSNSTQGAHTPAGSEQSWNFDGEAQGNEKHMADDSDGKNKSLKCGCKFDAECLNINRDTYTKYFDSNEVRRFSASEPNLFVRTLQFRIWKESTTKMIKDHRKEFSTELGKISYAVCMLGGKTQEFGLTRLRNLDNRDWRAVGELFDAFSELYCYSGQSTEWTNRHWQEDDDDMVVDALRFYPVIWASHSASTENRLG